MKNEKISRERKWITKKDAMRYLSVSQRCIENWCKNGVLASYRLSGKIFFDQVEIDEKIGNSRNGKK